MEFKSVLNKLKLHEQTWTQICYLDKWRFFVGYTGFHFV